MPSPALRVSAGLCLALAWGPRPAAPQVCTTTTLYANDFEAGAGLAGWSTGFLFGNQATVNDWRGIEACAAHSDSYVFRFGGEGCEGDYGAGQVAFAAAPALAVPAGATTARFSVWHRRDFEAGSDGGRMAVRVDGSSIFMLVQTADIVSGASHDGTLDGDCPATSAYASMPVFTSAVADFAETVVDLDAVCDAATNGSGGCAGHSVEVGFLAFTDCATGGDGWFLDDLVVTACVPPPSSQLFTVAPCRLLDTRDSEALSPHVLRTFTATGGCGIPASARALAVNVTAVGAGAAGEIALWAADGEAMPPAVVAFGAGQNRANNALVQLPADGSGTVNALATSEAAVHLVVDVVGYFE